MTNYNFLSFKEALLLKSIPEINVQISCRREIIHDCMGSLYPCILEEEIRKLIKRKLELEDPLGDFQI